MLRLLSRSPNNTQTARERQRVKEEGRVGGKESPECVVKHNVIFILLFKAFAIVLGSIPVIHCYLVFVKV
jgi:hypothetical protein